ncbi:glycosyltransferase [Bacillus sp. DNRA2]|uniref:glycosyltransferase n=1 Tax=Bacillus sp. DNRA2 TaxID=2723053 RepID=UPI00145D14DB|nr:glycosyltransferase [Bacillus sp. DNRA2]NMD68812.1 glycosyltransferase [Bacillus sp. DNRA2]
MNTTIVMVVYKLKISESKTYQSLKSILHKKSFSNLSVIIYDNSPDAQSIPEQIENVNVIYKHDPRNIGIVTAYNFAFHYAKENGSDWLLLLDHDTALTEEYFNCLVSLNSINKDVAAVVPMITSESALISPVFSDRLRPLQGNKPVAGIQNTSVMAINSGALLKISFLTEISGFNEQFPLDYLDHWLFHQIYENGYKVMILDTVIAHELSVMDYANVSLKRYQSILDSEIRFYKEYKKDLLPAYKRQLIKRLLKQMLLVKNKKIAAYTLRRLVSV